MDIETSIKLLSIFGGSVAFVFGIFQYYKTIQLQNFRTYADKYNQIIPPEMYKDWNAAINGDRSKWEQLTPTMISYLNIVWEEYHLCKSGALSKSLWKIWSREIHSAINSDFGKTIAHDYKFHFPTALFESLKSKRA